MQTRITERQVLLLHCLKLKSVSLVFNSWLPVNQHGDAGLHEGADDVDGGDLEVQLLVLENTAQLNQTLSCVTLTAVMQS